MTSGTFFSSIQSLNYQLPKPQSSQIFHLRRFNVDSTVCACAGSPIGSTRKLTNRLVMSKSISPLNSSSDSTAIVDNPSAFASSSGVEEAAEEPYTAEEENAMSKVGARVRVKVPLKVYHIPKVPEVELEGMEGVMKQYVGIWKGKRISANFPFKVAFVSEIEGREGPVKFFVHMREDEFEYLD